MEYQDQPHNDIADQVLVHNQANQGNLIHNQTRQLQYQMEEAEKNLADAQLDCEATLTRINHLLRQDKLIIVDGVFDWKDIEDPKKRVLTDEGVERIMQVMQSYINKETLLSNFDEKTIARRMLEFCLAFSGLMFQKYEVFFRTPTLEECEYILNFRISEKIKIKKMSCNFSGNYFDEDKVKKEILSEMENTIEYEIKKIKEERTKLNLREFEMMFTQMKALVEATHNRAWKGEERGSLRRHFNISEVIGGRATMPEKKGGMFSGWGRS
jgi:hypothetical protein